MDRRGSALFYGEDYFGPDYFVFSINRERIRDGEGRFDPRAGRGNERLQGRWCSTPGGTSSPSPTGAMISSGWAGQV